MRSSWWKIIRPRSKSKPSTTKFGVTELHAVASRSRPASVLTEEARTLKAGLLVLGAYGRMTVADFFLGSTTRGAIEKSPAPVFLHH